RPRSTDIASGASIHGSHSVALGRLPVKNNRTSSSDAARTPSGHGVHATPERLDLVLPPERTDVFDDRFQYSRREFLGNPVSPTIGGRTRPVRGIDIPRRKIGCNHVPAGGTCGSAQVRGDAD